MESYLLAPSASPSWPGMRVTEGVVLIKRRKGSVVSVAGRCAVVQENLESDHKELREAIEFMNAKQSKQWATMDRKQKLMSEAPEENRRKVIQDVLVLEDRISAVSVPDTARVGFDGKAVSRAPSSEGEVALTGARE